MAVLLRVTLFVAAGLAIFGAAYLGYFIVPFLFLLVALSILGLSGVVRRFVRPPSTHPPGR